MPLLDSTKARLKDMLRAPSVAWPTLALLVGAVALWIFALSIPTAGLLSVALKMGIIIVACQGIFTVMHDAAHKALSRHGWVNAAAGRLCGSLFLRAFPGFRFAHLKHHKHTNHPDHDPDYWSGQGPWWQLPWKWLTQDNVYRRLYRANWHKRPLSERREVVLTTTLECLFIAALVASGYGFELLFFWLVPAKLSLAMLAFTIDYLPHRPHQVRAGDNRFQTTNVRPSPFLALLTLYQNLHGVHHVYPSAPFYRYGAVWKLKGKELETRGMLVKGPRQTHATTTRLQKEAESHSLLATRASPPLRTPLRPSPARGRFARKAHMHPMTLASPGHQGSQHGGTPKATPPN